MPPVSQERVDWIEQRLFILARTMAELNARGYVYSTRARDANHQALMLAAKTIHAEQISLMAEQTAITNYLDEQKGT